MIGWSRGGLMSYRVLTQTNRLKAVVIGSGLSSARSSISERAEMDSVFSITMPAYKINKDSVLTTRSPVEWSDKLSKSTPLLILHGTADWRASPTQSFEMSRKLYEAKHPFRLVIFEGGEHSLMEHYDEVNHQIKSFFDTYVRDLKKWPSLEPHGD
jgi:dipeptidyl aminopeptidase/acylaminoacyl peptidase